MTLIKSISGIRGTIGGGASEALTPVDIVKFTTAYAKLLRTIDPDKGRLKVVVGRDGRISGKMVQSIVCGTLTACGIDVVDAGMASTPTVEMAVLIEGADGGIILTASHNPVEWNALKLLNNRGEFLSAAQAEEILRYVQNEDYQYSDVYSLGVQTERDFTNEHIEAVISHPLVNISAIYRAGFKVVLDSINSVGGVIMPRLFEALGVNCISINGDPHGDFVHNPEPLPGNLTELSERVVTEKADLGVAVDPDVDRLALICEDGTPFGEEYTLVSVADYVLNNTPGATVSNLSSTRALRDITEFYGEKYYASAVGEVNVVAKMKGVNAVVGGEGNGGVIVPDLHYGRDALIGVALFLSNLAEKNRPVTELRRFYPQYYNSKNRIELSDQNIIDKVLCGVKDFFSKERITDIDGIKVDFDSERSWVHLRKSNTEPIIRIYAEAPTLQDAENLARKVMDIAKDIIK